MKWSECGWFPESVDLGAEGERESEEEDLDGGRDGQEGADEDDGDEENNYGQ